MQVYALELEGLTWPQVGRDGKISSKLKTTKSAKKSSKSISRKQQGSETFLTLTEFVSKEKLMCFPPASHANLFLSKGIEEEKAMNVSYGRKCIGLLERSGRDFLLAKMFLESSQWKMAEPLQGYKMTWRAWVTRCNVSFCQLRLLKDGCKGNDVLFWPTPTASDSKRIGELKISSLIHRVKGMPGNKYNFAEHAAECFDQYPTAEFVEWLMGFPVGYTDTTNLETP